MSGYLVGIDVGTQSAKVVVHRPDGSVVAEGRAPLRPPLTPAPGVVEHPDEDLWDALGAACRAATGPLGDDAASITAVGLCGVRFCRALMRADGSLAGPVLSWMDDRVSRPHEQTHDEVAWVAAASGYLTQRLTGRFRDSVASYQGQWPVDPQHWRWLDDEDRLSAFGVPRDRLMDLVMPGDVLGELTSRAAAVTGLPAGVPVVATGNDKAVEALGGGMRSADDLMVSLGTYVAAMSVGRSVGTGVRPVGSSFWTNFSAVPGEYLVESSGIRRGMWTVSWLRDLLAGSALAATHPTGTELERMLDSGAAVVPAGSAGLVTVLDWLAPVEAPWRRGAFVGLDVRHGPFHLYRSVLEALALTMQGHAAAMVAELGSSPDRVVVSGGGSRSDLMLQIVADVFDLPAARGDAPSAAALGAAMAAAVATGAHPSFDAAAAAMAHDGLVLLPTSAGRSTYASMRGLHTDLVTSLEPVLRRTRDLFS